MTSRLLCVAFAAASLFAAASAFFRSSASTVCEPLSTTCALSAVCFAIDQSGSIQSQYDKEVQFVEEVARALSSKASDISFSATAFASGSEVVHPGTTDVNQFVDTVRADPFAGGQTNIAAGLQACFETVKDKGGVRIIVLLTDGDHNTGPPMPLEVANTINGMGDDTAIMTVGIGPGVTSESLKQLAKADEFHFPVSFTGLPDIIEALVKKLCTPAFCCEQAFVDCDFKFEGSPGIPVFNIGVQPDSPFTTAIVSKDWHERLGVLNTNIVPEFILDNGLVFPITNFGSQPLTPSHFKPLSVEGPASAIAHQTFHGNQLAASANRCVRMYFSHFQLLDPATGNVIKNMNDVPISMNKCVVFRTKLPPPPPMASLGNGVANWAPKYGKEALFHSYYSQTPYQNGGEGYRVVSRHRDY